MVDLEDFVLFLKQELGIQQSVARDLEGKGIFKISFKFRKFS